MKSTFSAVAYRMTSLVIRHVPSRQESPQIEEIQCMTSKVIRRVSSRHTFIFPSVKTIRRIRHILIRHMDGF